MAEVNSFVLLAEICFSVKVQFAFLGVGMVDNVPKRIGGLHKNGD